MSTSTGRILRMTRIVAALIVWGAATCMLVSYGMRFQTFAGWIARVQFMDAAMAFSISTVILWLLATLIFGRIYCSVACPLGVWQDMCARSMRMTRKARKKRRYHYSPELAKCRNISLAIVLLALVFGVSVVTHLIDPWSIYSRTCVYIVKPAWGWLVNLMSQTPVMIATASIAGIIVAGVSIVAISIVAAKNGRTYCNSICPVGTALGYVSRYSIFHIDINTDKCIQCRKCEHECKSSCIDLTSHVVDSSRCVDCFDCLPVCPNDAIHYTWIRHQLSIPMMQKIHPLAGSAQCMSGSNNAMSVKHINNPATEKDSEKS